jgi:hypothetical protein
MLFTKILRCCISCTRLCCCKTAGRVAYLTHARCLIANSEGGIRAPSPTCRAELTRNISRQQRAHVAGAWSYHPACRAMRDLNFFFFFLSFSSGDLYGPSEGLVYLSSDPSTGRQVPQHDERSSVMEPCALPRIAVKAARLWRARASPGRCCLSAERLDWMGVHAGTLDAL